MALTDRSLAHHARFARALALVSTLGASAAGCYEAHAIGGSTDGAAPDAARPDSAAPDSAAPDSAAPDSALVDAGLDTGLTCETCDCSWTSPPPENSCEAAGLWMCCAAVGPLAPPDLAV